MNEEFRNAIKRLRDIYNYLTEGEPSPDEEEESQKEMITLLESLHQNIPPENMEENLELLKTSLGMAKEWDTLEFWFKEKPDLVTNVKLILNRFLIRHADPEPEREQKLNSQISVPNGVSDELSGQLAAALERAMKNLPADADVTKVIQSVTSQVTENYMAQVDKSRNAQYGNNGAELADASDGSSRYNESTMGHRYESGVSSNNKKTETMMSTAARVKIRKEDIMKSVLEQVKNNLPQPSQKLTTPKIVIPKVTRPKQKIIPYSEEPEQSAPLTIVEQKQQQLEVIPSLQPQEKPKVPPKLKVSAFKKGETSQAKITTYATVEDPQQQSPPQSSPQQQPIRPKIVVKPRIMTKVEEIKTPKPQPQSGPQLPIEPIAEPAPEPPQVKTPKLDIQAKIVSKRKQREAKKDTNNEISLKFNVVKPTSPSVKDTQIDLFETFSKQESKKDWKRNSKKKSVNLQIPDNKSTQTQVSSSMEGVEFPEESISYEKMDKNQLYQELIALEGKKYAIEKSRKDFKAKHEKGLISDGNYAAQLDRFKYDLNYISKKINEIRQRIQTL